MKKFTLYALLFLFFFCRTGQSQEVNQDESKVQDFVLPELLTSRDGKKITTVAEWEQQRRPELITLFSNQMYGSSFSLIASDPHRKHNTIAEDPGSLNGKAICKQVKLTVRLDDFIREALLLIYLPETTNKVPVFLSYNFQGNHSVSADPQIIISPSIYKVSDKDQSSQRGNQSGR